VPSKLVTTVLKTVWKWKNVCKCILLLQNVVTKCLLHMCTYSSEKSVVTNVLLHICTYPYISVCYYICVVTHILQL